jgi:hypothetical protein
MMTTVTLAHHAFNVLSQGSLPAGLERTTQTVMVLVVSLVRLEELTLTSIRPPNVLNARLGSSRLRVGQRHATSAEQVRRRTVSVHAPHAQLASMPVLQQANAWTVLLARLILTKMLALCVRAVSLESMR